MCPAVFDVIRVVVEKRLTPLEKSTTYTLYREEVTTRKCAPLTLLLRLSQRARGGGGQTDFAVMAFQFDSRSQLEINDSA
jgi:hypothetical protein